MIRDPDIVGRVKDLRKLVDEAARETYSPFAKRCWLVFHQWTMWDVRVRPGYYQYSEYWRRCVRCGRTQSKEIW